MAKFHVTRIRQAGGEWYDPQTDIKRIIPDVLETVTSQMEELSSDNTEAKQLAYLHECLRIFLLRITEDTTPLDSQLSEFLEALSVCPAQLLHKWLLQVGSALLCVFGLFSRRDSAVDNKAYDAMMGYTQISLLKNLLPAGVWGEIKEKAGNNDSVLNPLVQSRTVTGGEAFCFETQGILTNLKAIARRYMSCSGAPTWNELAEACDKAFMDGKQKSDMEQIALGLSYPTYKYPTMQLEVDGGSEDKNIKITDEGRSSLI